MNFTVHGWAGGNTRPHSAKRTDHVIGSILEWAEAHRTVKCSICGDINGEIKDLPMLNKSIMQRKWADLGQKAYLWGTPIIARPTCWAPGSIQGTRRDYVLAAAAILPDITGFGVCPCGDIPTHATVQVRLRRSEIEVKTRINKKPMDLHEAYVKKVDASNASNIHDEETNQDKRKAELESDLKDDIRNTMDQCLSTGEKTLQFA